MDCTRFACGWSLRRSPRLVVPVNLRQGTKCTCDALSSSLPSVFAPWLPQWLGAFRPIYRCARGIREGKENIDQLEVKMNSAISLCVQCSGVGTFSARDCARPCSRYRWPRVYQADSTRVGGHRELLPTKHPQSPLAPPQDSAAMAPLGSHWQWRHDDRNDGTTASGLPVACREPPPTSERHQNRS